MDNDKTVFRQTRTFKITRKDNKREYYKATITLEIRIVEGIDWNFRSGKFYTVSFSGDLYYSAGQGSPHLYSFGQIVNTLVELISSGEWNMSMDLVLIVKLWNRYHLNDLTPGTEKQMNMIRKYNVHGYNERVKFLKSKGLYIDDEYRYGTKWLIEPVPNKYINIMKSLFDTKQHYHEEISL